MFEASQSLPGDTVTLADRAASRQWRGHLKSKYQVRAEKLRIWATETPNPELRRKEGKGDMLEDQPGEFEYSFAKL